ncbi:MAG TPA: TAXI family TRAP transporter solute-binding subunit [Myxococcales bacterium]|nr:TAXI family TRAP transporter solute-binding subunit [Myxococcales bacterium]
MTMIERRALGLGLIALAGLLLPGHSPYTQWYAYRAKHLVVVTDARPGALDLAQAVATAVVTKWPESKAVAAQARSTVEAVRLLSSGQLQVALIPSAAAFDALQGQGNFAADGKLQLRAIAALGDEVLVVLDAYPRERARTLAGAIADSTALSSRAAGGQPRIPYHPGVRP